MPSMLKARLAKEIVVKVHNEIGLLAQITRLIAEKGLDLRAAAAWVEGTNGIIHLVTNDNLRAMDALRAKSYQPKESDVVLTEMPHKPGLLRHLTEKLAQAGTRPAPSLRQCHQRRPDVSDLSSPRPTTTAPWSCSTSNGATQSRVKAWSFCGRIAPATRFGWGPP